MFRGSFDNSHSATLLASFCQASAAHADAAYERHDDRLGRHVDIDIRQGGELEDQEFQRTRKSGKGGRKDEDRQLVRLDRVTARGRAVILPNCQKDAAKG